MIKLFALDLDGTLLDNESKLGKENISALRKLNEYGVKTVLASGRVFSSLCYFESLIGTYNPIIANNGAINALNRNSLYKTYLLKDEVLKDLSDFAREYELDFHFYDENTFYTNRLDLDRISHLKKPSSYGLNYQVGLVVKDDPVEYFLSRPGQASKFQISNLDKHELSKQRVLDLLKDKFDGLLSISASSDKVLEIMAPNTSKWQGIRDICEVLGISNNEVAAIGDSYNDIEMVKNSKYGFAMANANDKLKTEAYKIVSTNESGGIIEAAKHILEVNKNA